MNILVLGSGGREHAFAAAIRRSALCENLYILPGNGGTALLGINLPGSAADFIAIKKYVIQYAIDLVLVGPEEPLIMGISDFFLGDQALKSVKVIGPSRLSARLEGSKDFSKRFMQRHSIPTAAYRTFARNQASEALEYIEGHSLPIVMKADGMAAGKGVMICETHEIARRQWLSITEGNIFGKAGDRVVIEEFLEGIELSLFVLTDGKSYKILPEAKDYKRIGEGDSGPNTGGMGSVSPVAFFTNDLRHEINETIIIPSLEGMREEGMEFHGFLFIGLMIRAQRPYVIEYNVRMGDPETQSIMPRIRTDFVALLKAVSEQKLDLIRLEIDPNTALTVVLSAGGYPGVYAKGDLIMLPDSTRDSSAPASEMTHIMHAGTRLGPGGLVTDGGRVMAVTALGETLQAAQKAAYAAIDPIKFEGKYYRKDIGMDL